MNRHSLLRSLLLAAVVGLVPMASTANAATITVDGTTCALGDAIVAANTNAAVGGCPAGDAGLDTIVLDADVTLSAVDARSTDVEGGAGGLPDVTEDLIITAGAADLIQRDPLFTCELATADPTFRFINHTGGTLTVENIRFENGCLVGPAMGSGINTGGGIRSQATALNLLGITVRNHGIFSTDVSVRGGFAEAGDGTVLVMMDSLFEDLVADAPSSIQGGVIAADGAVTVNNTLIRGLEVDSDTSVQGGAYYFSIISDDDIDLIGNVVVDDVTVQSDGSIQGGVLYFFSASSTLTLDDVRLGRIGGTSTGSSVQGGVLYVNTVVDASVVFDNLQIDTVTTTSNSSTVEGGAIYLIGDSIVRNTVLRQVEGFASNVCLGGALFTFGFGDTLSVSGLVIEDALCDSESSFARGGGFHTTTSTLTLRDCVLRNNRVAYSTQGQGGGLYASGEIEQLARCTFADNVVAPRDTSALGDAQGGGAFLTGDDAMHLRNVTATGNVVMGADAISDGVEGGNALGGGISVDSNSAMTVDLTHVTIAGNEVYAGFGAPGLADGLAAGGGLHVGDVLNTVLVDNAILANNVAFDGDDSPSDDDCFSTGTFGSLGYNVAETPDASCDFTSFGDITKLDPRLYELADRGCDTTLPDGTCVPTMAIDQTSWAVDWGSCVASNVSDDARAFLRRQDVPGVTNLDDACDSGAYEAYDSDGDGFTDLSDGCPDVADPDQADGDGDGFGDACDLCQGDDATGDDDSDLVCNDSDICPGFDDGVDGDSDGAPDGCDICPGFDDNVDDDSDGAPDGCDICPGFDDNVDSDLDGSPDGCDLCQGNDATGDGDMDGKCADRDCDDGDPTNACELFLDGFESADTSAWSATTTAR
ncbi:MAG: hypothetical protein AAF772_05625 [Acidobacteriota bacterium]